MATERRTFAQIPHASPAADFRPLRYRPDGIGAWSGHIPFACDLIHFARPRVFVELGTHYGESYFAFCQAMVEAGVTCAASAVDTWQGDAHTRAYGGDVFAAVEQYNGEHYASFSNLVRMFFDEAAPRFETESIDILHIDGLHTYDAVRHDFETWIGKVKPGGVVLFHDVAVRQGDFGVWRYWEELKTEYETFTFAHSHGLGVLRKPWPSAGGGWLDGLFQCASPEGVRKYYEMCADRIAQRARNESEQKGEITFNSQLFWCDAGGVYSEDASSRAVTTARRAPVVLRLPIWCSPTPPAELRLDLTDRPAVFAVSRVVLASDSGAELHRFDPRSDEVTVAGARITYPNNGTEDEFWVHAAGDQNSLVLTIPEAVRAASAALELTLTHVPASAALDQAFSGSMNTREKEQEYNELRRLREAFPAVEGLAKERLAAIVRYDQALGHAQHVASTLQEALSFAERLAQERLDEIARYDQALGHAQHVVKAFEIERAQIRTERPFTAFGDGSAARLYLDLLKQCLGPGGQLDSVEQCVLNALQFNVPGDLVDAAGAGVAPVLMRALLAAAWDGGRHVWVLDETRKQPLEQTLAAYRLLDERVRFPATDDAIERAAVLLIGSSGTSGALERLYPKLSRGGYVLVENYAASEECRTAVQDYRNRNGLREEIEYVEGGGISWQRE